MSKIEPLPEQRPSHDEQHYAVKLAPRTEPSPQPDLPERVDELVRGRDLTTAERERIEACASSLLAVGVELVAPGSAKRGRKPGGRASKAAMIAAAIRATDPNQEHPDPTLVRKAKTSRWRRSG